MTKPVRKKAPVRKGPRITFQVDADLDRDIREVAAEEFSSVSEKGQLSALLRKAVELYVSKWKHDHDGKAQQ